MNHSACDDLLIHFATHGFVVVGVNEEYTEDGECMIDAIDDMEIENAAGSGSIFEGKLDITKICAMGQSQGGGSAIKVGQDPRVTCTVPMMAAIRWVGAEAASGQNGPMLLISGSWDWTCSPARCGDKFFEAADKQRIHH